MKEQLKELFKSVDPKILTEEVVKNLDTLWEGAISAHIATLKEEIKNQLIEETRTELVEFKDNLINKLGEYTQKLAEEYLNEKVDVLEATMKNHLYENLFKGIVGVFKEHNLQLPEGIAPLAEDFKTKEAELKETANTLMEEVIVLKEEKTLEVGLRVWAENTVGMPLDQVEKLKTLMGEVEFEGAEDFAEKIKIMKESFLNSKDEDVDDGKKIINESADSDATKFASKLSKLAIG